jgi:hypothetical protein
MSNARPNAALVQDLRALSTLDVSVNEKGRRPNEERVISTEAVGALVAFLDSTGLDRRRYSVASRLRRIHDSDQFATLPEDLRERIREILADGEG